MFSNAGLRTRLRSQPFAEERTNGIERLGCRLQSSDACGKPVRHPHPDVGARVDAGGSGPLNEPQRVVEQHFVVTDMNAGRR